MATGKRFCPHCLGPVEQSELGEARRCPGCRLHVAAGRSIDADTVASHGRSSGAAANFLGAQARRDRPDIAVDPLVATRDLRRVADAIGATPDRLRMLDYQAAQDADTTLTSLGAIIGVHGSWKAARLAAASASLQSDTVSGSRDVG